MCTGVRPIQVVANRQRYVSCDPIGADDVDHIGLFYGHQNHRTPASGRNVALPPTTVPGGIDDQFCPIFARTLDPGNDRLNCGTLYEA